MENLVLNVRGIYSNSNELSSVPPGALKIADNIVIRKDSIAESRRGFDRLAFRLPLTSDRADRLLQYQNKLLVHYTGTSLAYYDSVNGITPYSGSYANPDNNLAKIKSAEANQNFYFTSSKGIQKLDSATGTPVQAGMYPGLDCQASSSVNPSGFMENEAQVAYRVVWGITDANGNLVVGSPSQRAILSNTSGGLQDATLTTTIPAGITVNHFFQVYRSNQSLGLYTTATGTIQDLTFTSKVTGTPGNFVQMTYTNGGSVVVTVSASTRVVQDLTYTSVLKGGLGDQVSIAYTSGGTAGAEVVTVNGNSISVKIQSGVSTANQILAAVNASSAATALVTVSVSGTGTNTQVSAGAVNLTGGKINVQIISGTSTASDIITGLNSSSAALAVITPAITGVSTNPQTAPASITLSGGSVSLVTPDDNMQKIYEASPTGASLVVQDITYSSVAAGTGGNSVTIAYTSGGTAGAEVVTVAGSAISVKIQSGVSTATQVLAGINASKAALLLVSAAITGTAGTAQTTAGATNLSGGIATLTITDSTPDSLRGDALYTNETQEGILQSNELPPYATDMAVFRSCLFFGNIKTKQRLQFSILAVGGSSGIALNDTITIAGTTYAAKSSEAINSLQYQLVTSGSASQNINDTALSLVRVINQNTTNTTVYARYVSTPEGLPGQILIEERTLGGAAYYATASAHGSAFSPVLPTSGTKVSSTNQVALNGLMYSKQQEPDAVPALNILYVGSASKKILRILALRDSLFILKEDGVFRCTGSGPENFSIDLLDNTAFLLAPESAATLSNQIFALTTQGVVAISDTGVEVMSRQIEDQLISLFGSSLTALQYYSFGVGYESEREYILWTVSESGDTSATQAFVYHTFTKAWTRWTRVQQHGVVLSADDRIYAVDPTTSYINQERKDGVYTDYADEALPVSITNINNYVITLNDVSSVVIGDLLYQDVSIASVITAVDVVNSTVTVYDLINSWTVGSAFIWKSINCVLEFCPNSAGQSGYLKQWSECVLMLKQLQFHTVDLNFYSDVSGGVDSVPISGSTGGLWGRFFWGLIPWGGVARSTPVRTYVPLEKQRADLLSVQFACREAWAQFQVEGVALSYRPISTRTGR